MRRLAVTAVVLLALAGLAGGAVTRGHAAPPVVVEAATEPTETPATPSHVVVDVAGAVARPGIQRLPAGARVVDALSAAGGTLPEADLAALNRAAPLRDGTRVYVPRIGEIPPPGALGEPDRTVDLNSASEVELDGLPGIGPSTAAKIVRSRAQRPFARVEELQTRGLVTPRVFADVRELVRVR